MAEAFARAYGSDVLIPASAGLSPAPRVATDTLAAMAEKGLDLRDHFPKSIRHLGRAEFDLVVNMSGCNLPEVPAARIAEWDVGDPISMNYEDHCAVRDQIETLVIRLVLNLRSEALRYCRA
jgi:arsenate reductase